MAEPFDSAWLKWGRGVVHAQALETQVTSAMSDFQAGQPYASSTKYDAKRHCIALTLNEVPALPPLLGLLLGDAANNFRSSLDQLGFTLAVTRSRRPLKRGEADKIYFPMKRSSNAFNSDFLVGLLQDRDRKIVRRFQPFWNRDRSRPHPKSKINRHCLIVLADLNRHDKHKGIRPVWMWPRGGEFRIGDQPTDCTITRIPKRARGILLEPGVEIQRVYVKKTGPNPDVYMDAKLTVEPTIDGRVTLNSWLAETTYHIRDLLLRFAQPPEEILTLGIVPADQRPPSLR
jgi:hypothetical protein